MSFIDRFLDAIKLNDDYDDDDEFLEDEDDEEIVEDDEDDEYEEKKPRKRFFSRFSNDDDLDDEDDDDEDDDAPARSRRLNQSRVSDDEAKYAETARRQRERDREREKEREAARREKEAQKREAARAAKKNASKVTSINNNRKKSGSMSMEVNVIRPTTMEDTREIADTLMNGCTVVLNLEGIDVDTAQRVIDFTCGVCYSLNGNLQKVSSYIFILTPAGVDISGDFQSILNGAFDIPSMKTQY